MFNRLKHTAPKAIALLAVILSSALAQRVSAQTSTVLDPVGDTYFRNAPAFQDVVLGQMTKTANGDFQLLMELADPVPANPQMPPQQRTEIWWGWNFDLDPAAFPFGYPWGLDRNSEFLFLVRWDGDEFTGTAIDRRPLLTGGEAVITPVPFCINGTRIEAVLPFSLIGEVPPNFGWAPFTIGWAGPVGSEGVNVIDVALTLFDPSQSALDQASTVSAQTSTVFDPVGDTFVHNAPEFLDVVHGQLTMTAGGDFVLLMDMAAPVPIAPQLPPPGVREIWWAWFFDFDLTAFPQGTPFPSGVRPRPEVIVYVRWNGTEFAGTMIDRRPLLTGGEAITTAVPFNINGATVEAVLASELIGAVPSSFVWGPFTPVWSGPVGSLGYTNADVAETVFNP